MLAMRQRVPRRVWDSLRGLSVLATVVLCITLVFDPKAGLFVFWGLIIAILPLVFLLAPGLWRNICPLATVHQVPRRLGRGRKLTLPPVLQRHGYVVAVALFIGIAPARKVLFNSNGPAVAALLIHSALAYRGTERTELQWIPALLALVALLAPYLNWRASALRA